MDISLSAGSNHTSSSVHSTQMSDNTFITMHELPEDIASNQSKSDYLLDLGFRYKGFRMGHINIQGVSNKTDQVRLLLESDKNQIHVLGLSESKLNAIHPDSAFEINGFQKPFRKDRETNLGVVFWFMLKTESVPAEELILNVKVLNVFGLKLNQLKVNHF